MSKLLFHYMNEYILYCIVLIYSFSIGILLLFIFFFNIRHSQKIIFTLLYQNKFKTFLSAFYICTTFRTQNF